MCKLSRGRLWWRHNKVPYTCLQYKEKHGTFSVSPYICTACVILLAQCMFDSNSMWAADAAWASNVFQFPTQWYQMGNISLLNIFFSFLILNNVKMCQATSASIIYIIHKLLNSFESKRVNTLFCGGGFKFSFFSSRLLYLHVNVFFTSIFINKIVIIGLIFNLKVFRWSNISVVYRHSNEVLWFYK